MLAFRRDLVFLPLVLQTAQTLADVINLYFYRVLPVPVPGVPFNAAVLAVLLVAIGMMLAQSEARTPDHFRSVTGGLRWPKEKARARVIPTSPADRERHR